MDNDADGGKLAEVVREAVKLTGRSDLRFETHQPAGAKDWNDVLRGNFLPAARASALDMK
jgi:hypothetical protein